MGILDEIYSATVVKTARPDRVNETQLAITDAMNEYHSLAFFANDIVDATLIIGARDSNGVNLKSYIPDLRKLMSVFINKDQKLPKLPLSGEEDHCPGYKLLGSTLTLNPTNLSSEVRLLYCRRPQASTSWILQNYPEAVAALAAFKVCSIVGNRVTAAALALEVGSIYPNRLGYKHQIRMENEAYEPDN